MPVTSAVLLATIYSFPILAVLWFIIGIFIFGFVTGPTPTLKLSLLFMLLTIPPSAFVYTVILRRQLSVIHRQITLQHAFLASVIALFFVHVSIATISLTQFNEGHYDGLTFICGLILGLGSAILFINNLSYEKRFKNRK